jgi:general secretion pathway protein A
MIQPELSEGSIQSAGLGLTTAPFAECDDDAFFFPSAQHVAALEFMGHSLWTRTHFSVVTTERGCGKSLLVRRLVRDLDESIVAAAVQREAISPREFLTEVSRQFGFPLDVNDKTDRRRLLERFLAHQGSKGRMCLLIVENAQSMHPSVLEELRNLARIEVEGARVLKLLLLGQSALRQVIDSPRMTELGAGGAPRFSLEPFSEEQTAEYIAHRLRAAGAADPDALLPHAAIPAIYACTGGVPAQVNRLCERAIACAVREGLPYIAPTAVDRAIEELGLRALSPMPLPQTLEPQAALPPSTSKLVLAMQGMPERELTLGVNRILIGRGEEADIRIDSVFVSRYHALVVRDGSHDLLLDLGSTNGLLVNSRRVVRHVLRHRDLIQIGPAKVTYINERTVPKPQVDPGETIAFARPGLPAAAGEEDGAVLAFGRLDTTVNR